MARGAERAALRLAPPRSRCRPRHRHRDHQRRPTLALHLPLRPHGDGGLFPALAVRRAGGGGAGQPALRGPGARAHHSPADQPPRARGDHRPRGTVGIPQRRGTPGERHRGGLDGRALSARPGEPGSAAAAPLRRAGLPRPHLPVRRYRAHRGGTRRPHHRLQPRRGGHRRAPRRRGPRPAVQRDLRDRRGSGTGARGGGAGRRAVAALRDPDPAAGRAFGAGRHLVLAPAIRRGRSHRPHWSLPGPLIDQADGGADAPGGPARRHRPPLREHRARDPESTRLRVGRHRGARPRAPARRHPRPPGGDRARANRPASTSSSPTSSSTRAPLRWRRWR